ncbi:MAG: CoA-binding protein, partial [Ornithinimicrobium sp.]
MALTSMTGSPRDLSKLFDPSSVAIVGASDDPAKYGNWVALQALPDTRPTHFVNRARKTVLGRRAAPSLASLGDQVDLVVIAVPAAGFEEAVDDALAAGARAIVGITSGLGELGGVDLQRQHAMVGRVRDMGALLLGPNSFGVLDHSTGLKACAGSFPQGPIALISQSGNLAMDIAAHLHLGGLGLSRLASIGNQADVDVAEVIDFCIDHEPTRAIAVYCEGFPDGRKFAQACASAYEAGKPVVLLTVGRGAASVRGAASHTGSLVTPRAVVQAVCDAVGAELVATPAEMAHLLQALTRTSTPPGPRVGVFADGGGHASLACDALEHQGLVVEPLSEATRSLAAARLPVHAGTSNPIDIAGAGERDLRSFYQVSQLLVQDADIDSVLLAGYFGGYRGYGAAHGRRELEVARQIGRLVADSGQTFVAHLMFDRSPAARALRASGVAVFRDVAAAAW